MNGQIQIRVFTGKRNRSDEGQAREALATLRSAMDWREDTPGFEEAHKALDHAG